MPTIELIGYSESRAPMKRSEIFKALEKFNPEIINDAVIVIHEKSSAEDMKRNRKPFVRVYSLNQENFEKVRLAIIKDEPTDIEFIQMAAFYPA